MSTIVVAADARWVRDLVKSACTGPGQEVLEVTRGQDVRTVVGEQSPDLVILDMQIANMGGLAVTIDLRLESSAGRIPDVSILLLLDREADRFLAKRVDADAELVKPVDPGTLRRTVDRLLARDDGGAESTIGEEMQRSRARTGRDGGAESTVGEEMPRSRARTGRDGGAESTVG